MRTTLLLCSCLALVACTTDDNTAPTISNLAYSPMTMPVGTQTTITGSLNFSDPDGDLDQLAVEITLPDASKQTLPMTDLQNVGSMTEGTIAWALIVVPPAAGRYDMKIWITDIEGEPSNQLMGSAMAQ
ncbi:MAG TPA: hypothetical protein VIV11_23425 [Kofleriaceae bacterium]